MRVGVEFAGSCKASFKVVVPVDRMPGFNFIVSCLGCVCVCVCLYKYICLYVYIKYMFIYICIYIHIHIYVYIHMYIYIYIIYIYIHVYICICIYVYIFMYTRMTESWHRQLQSWDLAGMHYVHMNKSCHVYE